MLSGRRILFFVGRAGVLRKACPEEEVFLFSPIEGS